jgi:hypothetical protein
MARGTPAAGQRRRWWKPTLLGCVAMPTVICGIGFFTCTRQIAGIGSRLPDEVKKLRAMGIQTEAGDLSPSPPVSDAQNAAPLYHSIFLQLDSIRKDPAQEDLVKLLDGFAMSSDASTKLPQVLQALQTHQGIYNEADKLGAKSGLDFKRDYRQGFALLFPEFAHQKRLVKWQCGRARALWMTANRDAAIQTLRNAYQIGTHLNGDEFLIGHLVYLATQAICHRTLQLFLEEARDDPGTLKKLKSLLESIPPQGNLRRALGGEVALGREGIRSLKGTQSLTAMAQSIGDPATQGIGWLDRLLANDGVRQMYEVKYLEAWRKIFERMPKDQEDWTGFKDEMVRISAQIEADRSFENILNRILFPIFGDAIDASAKQVAERRLAKLSIELLLMRPTGLPANLNKFGRLATDPFTGKPMGYKREGRAFKIWSVGPDRADQGGVARKPGTTGGNQGIDLVMGFDMSIPQLQPNESTRR